MKILQQFILLNLLFTGLYAQNEGFKNKPQAKNDYSTIYPQYDYLTPPKGSLNSRIYEHRYDQILQKILFKGLPEYFDVQYYSSPSFGAEKVLVVRKGVIYYNVANKNIWSTYYHDIMSNSNLNGIEKNKLLVKRYELQILDKDAQLLEKLYRAVLSKTRHRIYKPKEMNRVALGNDGTTHLFSIHNLGIKEGEIWSPKEGSRMHRLVRIHEKLIEIITKNETNQILKIHQSLRIETTRLVNDLNFVTLSFEKNTIDSIKDTIVKHLNEYADIKKLMNQGYHVADDLVYKIRKAKVRTIKSQENYYGYSEFRNWFNNTFVKDIRNVYKKELKNLDFGYLNIDLNLDVYLDLELDKKNFKLMRYD